MSESRKYNFSAGPAVMPVEVLEEAQRDLVCLPGAGASILEISHRSAAFDAIIEEAEANLRHLLGIPDNYRVLFLQGGARLQFSMIPMNLCPAGRTATYLTTGTWGAMAAEEAGISAAVEVPWSGKAENYRRVPRAGEFDVPADSAYVYYTSNETIQGVQFDTEPEVGNVPLVCDASSDFLSRPLDVTRYGLLYACAQKNAGAAGLTMVIIRDDLLNAAPAPRASMLDYAQQAAAGSRLNTPPTFAIYIFMLITRWLRDLRGGLSTLEADNRKKATTLYDVLDGSDFYLGHAEPASRSQMNVTFRLPTVELDAEFLSEAKKHDLVALKGHRSVGGMRASIYNAMPESGVVALRDFMRDFEARQG